MLTEKIKSHNEVNGFFFSGVEFALIALVILPFAIYYARHHRPLAALIAGGIVANSLTVTAFAIRSLTRREKDIGLLQWFNKEGRTLIASRYPNMTNDTLMLTAAVLIPFLLVIGVGYDLLKFSMVASG